MSAKILSNQPLRISTLLPLLLLSGNLFTACRSAPQIDDTLLNQDHYAIHSHLQIQSRAALPPIVRDIPLEERTRSGPAISRGRSGDHFGDDPIHPPFSPSERGYYSLNERQEACRRAARLNAHSKWLSLTLHDRQDQAEWQLRLGLGAEGRWSRCLNRAEERLLFFDSSDSCRLVVLYPCLPERY